MTDYYVSAAATNGYVVGNDSNPGTSKGSPFLTIGALLTALNADSGSTGYINDGTYDPAGDFRPNVTMTLQAENTGEVVLTNSSPVVSVMRTNTAFANDGVLTVVGIEFQFTDIPAFSTGNNDAAVTYAFTDCVFTADNANDSDAIISWGEKAGSLTLTRCAFNGTFRWGVNSSGSAGQNLDLNFSATNCTVNGTATQGSGAVFQIQRYAAGTPSGAVNVLIDGLTGAMSVPTGLVHNAIYILYCDGYEVKNCNLTVTSADTGNEAACVNILATDSVSTSNNGYIHDNTFTLNAPAGRGVIVGATNTANYATGVRVHNNYVKADTVYAATPHGITIGRDVTGSVYGNIVEGINVGILASITGAIDIAGNLVKNCYGYYLYSKGATGANFFNNTLYYDSASGVTQSSGTAFMSVTFQGATNNADAEFNYNIINSVGSFIGRFVDVQDNNQTATFDGNVYYTDQSLGSNPWEHGTNTYTTVAAWNGDVDVGTDYNDDPGLRFAEGPALGVGNAIGTVWWTDDFRDLHGKRFANPPSVGASELRGTSKGVRGIGAVPLRVLPAGIDLAA